ncbi:type 1 glutamine amidotransferase [Haloquadratum walsbyi]|nr:type 1 glutamine amidotransferase [Haloquadratum walsbyi]
MAMGNDRPRVALLNASHNDEETRRNFRRELDATLVEYNVTENERPTEFDFDGIVITGSRSSVYWDRDWIQPLIRYTAAADDRDIPILGVCYGHQVLAVALGGHVESMDEYELGYRKVTQTQSDALFEDIPNTFTVFTSHSDRVTELPSDATTLAENDYGIHAFRRENAWGVQFHPEYDRETARSITTNKDLSTDQIESVLDGITTENYAAACKVKQLFENFTAYIRTVQSDYYSEMSTEGEVELEAE